MDMEITGLKISRMHRGAWNKVVAFFDLSIETQMGAVLTVTGFKLIEGVNGMFVGFPSKKTDVIDNWKPVYKDTSFSDGSTRNMILVVAKKEYENPTLAETGNKTEEVQLPPMVDDNLDTILVTDDLPQ